MSPAERTRCRIRSEADLITARELLRRSAETSGLNVVDRTKFITAGSELARNIIRYGQPGGELSVEFLHRDGRSGLCATFSDNGAGIANVELAMRDGYSTGGGLGLGLPGTRRLVDEFRIDSHPGQGTTVVIVKWSREGAR